MASQKQTIGSSEWSEKSSIKETSYQAALTGVTQCYTHCIPQLRTLYLMNFVCFVGKLMPSFCLNSLCEIPPSLKTGRKAHPFSVLGFSVPIYFFLFSLSSIVVFVHLPLLFCIVISPLLFHFLPIVATYPDFLKFCYDIRQETSCLVMKESSVGYLFFLRLNVLGTFLRIF